MIYLYPTGGLCNRLRAISGAIQLATMKYTRGGVTILWKQDTALHARFNDLFMPVKDICGIHIKTYIFRHLKARFPVYSNVRINFSDIDSNSYNAEVMKMKEQVGERHFFIMNGFSTLFVEQYLKDRGKGDYVLETCYQHFGRKDFSYFTPQKNMLNRISELQQLLGEKSIGVHIRRTDCSASIEYSPLSLFISRMEEYLHMDPAVTFFLSTDDISVKRKLCNIFQGHVVVNNLNPASRSDLAGMQDAVVDLWTLSKTGRILGSYWSSFSDTAASLGHIPLEIVRKHEGKF